MGREGISASRGDFSYGGYFGGSIGTEVVLVVAEDILVEVNYVAKGEILFVEEMKMRVGKI